MVAAAKTMTTRCRWSPELHNKFDQVVDKFGGYQSATPSMILKGMSIPFLTINHVKSHLQKCRNDAKNLPQGIRRSSAHRRDTLFPKKASPLPTVDFSSLLIT